MMIHPYVYKAPHLLESEIELTIFIQKPFIVVIGNISRCNIYLMKYK